MAKTVLVVEDDGPIAEMLEQLLSSEGYAVRTAGSGPEALALVGGEAPDLITLDLALPDTDPAALLRGLRARAGQAPVVVISAHPDQLDAGHRALVAAVVQKPFDIDVMLENIARVLSTGGDTPSRPEA